MKNRIKVLFVENGIGYGGAIICLRHLVRHLDRTKFDPLVLTGRNGPLYQDIANDAPWRCIPDRLIDIPSLRLQLEAKPFFKNKTFLGKVVSQGLARIDDVANFLPAFLRTLFLLVRWKPDLVHLNNEPLCNRASLIASKLLGIPAISHVRGDQKGSFLMHALFKMPTKFITVSDWVADGVANTGVSREKIHRIYDGIELEKLELDADGSELRTRWGIPESAFVVGLVGLLIPWKGQRLFLEAGRQLLKRNPSMVLALVGGTPDECKDYESELREIAAGPDFRNRVVFTGHVSDMSSAYNALDIVVSASTSPEPLGTVVIESMTLARPLVAPAHGGALEMVTHEQTGLLFKPNSTESLVQEIQRFTDVPELRKTLGSAARAKALTAFSIANHTRAVTELYSKILGR